MPTNTAVHLITRNTARTRSARTCPSSKPNVFDESESNAGKQPFVHFLFITEKSARACVCVREREGEQCFVSLRLSFIVSCLFACFVCFCICSKCSFLILFCCFAAALDSPSSSCTHSYSCLRFLDGMRACVCTNERAECVSTWVVIVVVVFCFPPVLFII